MILRKSFYIRWSAGRSPRVHEVNPGRDPSLTVVNRTPGFWGVTDLYRYKLKLYRYIFVSGHFWPSCTGTT